MATYQNTSQGLSMNIPDDGQIFHTGDPSKIYIRMGNDVMFLDMNAAPPIKDASGNWVSGNTNISNATGAGGSDIFIDTGQVANQTNRQARWIQYFKEAGLTKLYNYFEQGDKTALKYFNPADLTTWQVDIKNSPTTDVFKNITDPQVFATYQPTLPANETFTKTVSPTNPQGSVVTSSTQGSLQQSPSLVDVLKNTGATGDTLANAVTSATQSSYTTPSGSVVKPSGQMISGPTASPSPSVSFPSSYTQPSAPTATPTTTPMQGQASAMQSQLGSTSTGSSTPSLPPPPTFTGSGASGTAPTQSQYPSAPTMTPPPQAPTLSPYQQTQAPSFGSLPQYQAPNLPQGNVPSAPTAPGLVNSADQYLQSYLATLSPTTQETGYQQQLAALQGQQASIAASRDLGVQAVGEQPIATPFVTGQQTAITSRAATQMGALGAQQVPLQAQLALEQAKRQAAMDVNKTQLTYAQQKDQTQNEYAYNIYQTQLNERARTLDENYRQQTLALQQAQQTYENQLKTQLAQNQISQQQYENAVSESRYQTETQNANAQQQFQNQMAAIQQQNTQAQQQYQNSLGQTQYGNEIAQQQFQNQLSLAQEQRLSQSKTGLTEVSPGASLYDPATGKQIYTAPTTASQNSTSPNGVTPSAFTTTNLQQGKTVKSGQLTYSGTDYQEDVNTLISSRGSDGYVDPALYVQLYNQWIQGGGLESDFKEAFPVKNYINPSPQSDSQIYTIIQRLRGDTGTGGRSA